MTSKEYIAALKRLGLTPYAGAKVLGIGIRQSLRYASGDQPVSEPVARLLAMYVRYGVPKEFRQD